MVIHLLVPEQKKERQKMIVSDASKPGTREPQLVFDGGKTVFDKDTSIPEPIKTPDSGPIFPDSSTNLLPLVEVDLADSDVESLAELRQADQKNAETAERQLAIQRHNNLIRDVFAGKLIRTVRIDEFDDGENKDAHMLVVVVRDGSALESNGTRLTRWSLKHARCAIPGNWHEEISDKVKGILYDLNADELKDPYVIEDNTNRTNREADQRATISYEEHLNALKRYNGALVTRYASKILLGLKVENDGRSITLIDKFLDQVQTQTWKFDRHGRLF